MTQEEMQREQAILMVANLMRTNPFQLEFVVKTEPAGVRIVYEVTQEEMDMIVEQTLGKTSRSFNL